MMYLITVLVYKRFLTFLKSLKSVAKCSISFHPYQRLKSWKIPSWSAHSWVLLNGVFPDHYGYCCLLDQWLLVNKIWTTLLIHTVWDLHFPHIEIGALASWIPTPIGFWTVWFLYPKKPCYLDIVLSVMGKNSFFNKCC